MILYLDNHEAAHAAKLKKGDRMIVVRMLKEQPPKGYEFDYQENGHAYFVEYIFIGGFAGTKKSLPWHTKLRYPVGVELAVKESWGMLRCPDLSRKWVYKADDSRDSNLQSLIDTGHWKWHPAITMPKEAVRFNFKVMENRVDKCENITMNEATLMGINGDPMRRYCPDDAAYYLEPYITAKYGKDAWENYCEIITLEGFNV